jgi:hypothetical protein
MPLGFIESAQELLSSVVVLVTGICDEAKQTTEIRTLEVLDFTTLTVCLFPRRFGLD